MADNFEGAAALRQQLRDLKREERKKIIENENAALDAFDRQRSANKAMKEKRMGDVARIKGRLAMERQEAKKKAEAKQKQRDDMLAACETDEERAALLAKWEAERRAEEAEAERLRLLALEQR